MKIYGSGLIRLVVQPEGEGASLWTISEVDECIEIDSELMNCFKDTTTSRGQNGREQRRTTKKQ